MRRTLEQLKAMDDSQLFEMWSNGDYPFDRATCGFCLTQHALRSYVFCKKHPGLIPSHVGNPFHIRTHLEEMYALRIFHDALYPQPVEAHKDSQEVEIQLEQGATL